ncbi:MAG: 23S rRNA (pseudouridine(1915)-N(3))-methyltransferase RlmH [Steroidobacterales bacterium]
MHLRVIAVGTRMPQWVQTAFEEYTRRLRSWLPLELHELPVSARKGEEGKADEGRQMLALLAENEFAVPLDERGSEPTTLELAHWLEARRAAGVDLSFLIGGADGLSAAVLARGQYRWSLSRLTLPHALVRVLLAEQLYRASSILAGHPYHRR